MPTFAAFVHATGYVDDCRAQARLERTKEAVARRHAQTGRVIAGAGLVVFDPPDHAVDLNDYSQWWAWKKGASWKHPHGPGSSIAGKDNYPSSMSPGMMPWRTASGRTSAPYRSRMGIAARGGLSDKVYPWGNDPVSDGRHGNFWEGHFPDKNTSRRWLLLRCAGRQLRA